MKALSNAKAAGCKTSLISAVNPEHSEDISTITLNVNQYHTSEVLFLLLTYELIDGSGSHCPDIISGRDSKVFDFSR